MTPAELRAARHALGLTQEGLAERLQMSQTGKMHVSQWERGTRPIPRSRVVAIELMLQLQAARLAP